METLSATPDDLDTIFDLYDSAIEFQKKVFHKHWLGFDRELVKNEIAENRLWKLIDEGVTACIWSIAYDDPMIWGERSGESAMYIHRIVTAPGFHGRGYVRMITEWAIDHARRKGLRFVRMDTWGDNRKLLEYYQKCGFRFLGLSTPEESESLPKHYSGVKLSLFEIDLEYDQATV